VSVVFYLKSLKTIHVYFETFRIVLNPFSIGNKATLPQARKVIQIKRLCDIKNAEKQTQLLVISKTLKVAVKLPAT